LTTLLITFSDFKGRSFTFTGSLIIALLYICINKTRGWMEINKLYTNQKH